MTNQLNNEVLFNSVESELARRHAVGETPDMLVSKSTSALRVIVKGWWQLYQESQSIVQLKNRSVWQRYTTQPAKALDTPALVNSLKQISELINLTAIGQFRTPAYHEESAVILLQLIINYYAKLQN